jgi:hypothetical protein
MRRLNADTLARLELLEPDYKPPRIGIGWRRDAPGALVELYRGPGRECPALVDHPGMRHARFRVQVLGKTLPCLVPVPGRILESVFACLAFRFSHASKASGVRPVR